MIFGSGSAKIQEVSSTSSVILDYSTMEASYIEPDEDEHTSVLTGYRSYTTLGDYSSFKVNINLFKYGNINSQINKFKELYGYIHKNVYFWPHADGRAISGSDNQPVPFHVTDMKIIQLDNNYKFFDTIQMQFNSIKYTDISKSI